MKYYLCCCEVHRCECECLIFNVLKNMAVFTFNVTFTVLCHHTRPIFLVSWPLVYEKRGVRRSGIQNDAVLPRQEALQKDGHRNKDFKKDF